MPATAEKQVPAAHFEFQPTNKYGNTVRVKYRGIDLGRLYTSDVDCLSKRERRKGRKARWHVIDPEKLDIAPHLAPHLRRTEWTDMIAAARFMLSHKKKAPTP